MRRRCAVLTATLLMAALAIVPGVATAMAGGLPRLLATNRCVHGCERLVGVFEVRPRRVELQDLAGGTLTLDWSRWNRREALGSGHGYYIGAGASYHYPVKVRALRVRHGDFTRLAITKTYAGETAHYTLRLGHRYGEALWLG
jgi:hypothetical protein